MTPELQIRITAAVDEVFELSIRHLVAIDEEGYGSLAVFFSAYFFPPGNESTGFLGVGVLGGFLPFVAAALTLYHGNIFAGLWYPVIIAGVTAVVGWVIMPEIKDADIG